MHTNDTNMDKKEIDIRDLDLVFFDCEFTGLEFKHELIEIGFVKVKAKTYEVITEKAIKIKPQHLDNANPIALDISGYKEKEWENAGDLKFGLEDFLSYTKDCMLVGQNVAIDLLFLRKSMAQYDLQPNYFYKALDTYSIAWAKLRDKKDIKKFSLTELAPYFNIDMGDHHRALDDARTTFKVFVELMKLP